MPFSPTTRSALVPLALGLALCAGCDDGDASTGADGTPAQRSDGGLDPGVVSGEPEAVIGPSGGTLQLGEITLRVPAATLDEDTSIRLKPTEGAPGPFAAVGFQPVGPAFRIEPPIAPVSIEVQVGDATARLVSSSPGIRDGPNGARAGLVHVAQAPNARHAGVARFDLAYTPSTWQVMTRAGLGGIEELEQEVRRSQAQEVRRSQVQEGRSVAVPNSCAAAMAAIGLPEIADIDQRVILIADPLALMASWRVDCDLEAPELAAAVDRFAGRVCQAASLALGHYTHDMALPVPDRPLLVLLNWSWRHETGDMPDCEHGSEAAPSGTPIGVVPPRPSNGLPPAQLYGACDNLRPSEEVPFCDSALAWSNGMGLDLFFNPTCRNPYAGCLAPEGAGCVGDDDCPDATGCDPLGWSSSGFNMEQGPDELEHVVAHEIFHWIHDEPNDPLRRFPGPVFFTEGAAEAAAEQVFDAIVSEPTPARTWSTPTWSQCGLHPYRMHAFWRWLEASSGQSPLRLYLEAMKQSETPWTAEDGWNALDELFETLNDSDRVGALADFAAAWLVRHDFERPEEGDPGGTGDNTPDALGLTLGEETPGELWGPWDEGFVPSADTPVPMATSTIEVETLPQTASEELPPYTTRVFAIDVSALDQRVRLRVGGRAEGRVEHLGLRLLLKRPDEPSTVYWKKDRIEAAEEVNRWSATVLSAHLLESTWWLVVANPLYHALDLDLRFEAVPDRIVAMTGDGVVEVEVRGQDLVPTGPPIAAPSDARGVLAVGSGMAVLARRDGTVALVDLEARQEIDLDGDPLTTSRGAPQGLTRFDLGADSLPEGAAVTPDDRFALVALRGTEEIAVLDLSEHTVCKRVGVGRLPQEEAPSTLTMSEDGQTAWLSFPGLSADPLQEVARLDVAALQACDEHGGEVQERFLTGARRTGALAVSRDGLLAVASRALGRVRVLQAHTGDDANIPWREAPYFDAGQIPVALAWAPDNQRIYIGNVFGVEDTPLAGHGTVNVGERATGRDSYHVGVVGSVTGVVVTDDNQRVVAGDDQGNLTILPVSLWDGAVEHIRPPFSRSGGCWNERQSSPAPCPPTLTLPAPIEGLIKRVEIPRP